MQEPKPATWRHELVFPGCGGDILKLADLDGDGRLEVIVLQATGQAAVAAGAKAAWRAFTDDEDRRLHCLTALRLDGTVLWQRGTSWSRPDEPFVHHGGTTMMLAEDIDGDGLDEIVVFNRDRLWVFGR